MEMRQKSLHPELPSERIVKNIRRATRKRHSSEEKIRIVLDGLRGESSIAELCRREGIAEGLYYAWSKEFLEAGKRRLAGDTARAATSGEVKDLRRQAQELKAVVFQSLCRSVSSSANLAWDRSSVGRGLPILGARRKRSPNELASAIHRATTGCSPGCRLLSASTTTPCLVSPSAEVLSALVIFGATLAK